MPAPTPYIFVHCDPATVITRVGLLTETGQPIMLNSCTARASLTTDRLEDFYGDLYAQAWGSRKLSYDLSMDQFAQYGISDSYLGRIDPTLLNNLALNFGMGATTATGIALLTQASRELIPAKIAKVQLTVEVEDTRHAGLGSPDGPSTPAWITGTTVGTRPTITSSSTLTGTVGTPFSYTIVATGTLPITFSLGPGEVLPDGLTRTGDSIAGTPTGPPGDFWTEVRASNAYGTSFARLHFTIAAVPVVPPARIQAYVRYLVDSGSATVPDGFWALGYSGMSPDPTNEATVYLRTPTDVERTATDPGLPDDPDGRTGALVGTTPVAVTATGADDTFHRTSHGLSAGDRIIFPTLSGGSGLLAGQTMYYVIADGLNANDFKISLTLGGPAENFSTVSSGTMSEITRIWQITEILGYNTGTEEYEYWYQRTPATDTALLDAVTRGVDILNDATTEQVVGEDIGTAGPGDPTPSAWPGVIVPSTRIEQYYVWKNFLTNKTTGAGLGGDKTYPDLPSFLAAFPYLHLNHTETQTTVLLEYYQRSGTSGYIHQHATSDTRIATQLGLTLSPIYNGVDLPGGFTTSLPELIASMSLLPLPTPPGTSSGPAPDALTWLYVLERAWNGSRQCWGLHAYPPTSLTLARLLSVYGKITSRANHDECTYGRPWVEEVWMRFASVASGAWQCYWLDPTLYPTTALAPIGNSLADSVSPVNNPLVAPGLVYSDSTIQW